ncbi:Trafficking protein particle complex subunit 11 domain-containing protein [Entamoeba marina]
MSKPPPPPPKPIFKPWLNTSQPLVSDYLEWFSYTIRVHEMETKFDAVKEKLRQALAESYENIDNIKHTNFKNMSQTNSIHILTRCNYQTTFTSSTQRCDTPLLHMYLFSSDGNDALRRIKTVQKENPTRAKHCLVILLCDETKPIRRIVNESNDIKAFYLQLKNKDVDIQMKELLTLISKAVVLNYEQFLKEYTTESHSEPNPNSLHEVTRYASHSFEASILAQKVGDFDQAIHFIKSGLSTLGIYGDGIQNDVKVDIESVKKSIESAEYGRSVEEITPLSISIATRREAFVQLMHRLVVLYMMKDNYNSLCKRFIQLLGMHEKFVQKLTSCGVVVPLFFHEFFAYDACDKLLLELKKKPTTERDNFFVSLNRFLNIKKLGESCFIFDSSPDVVHWDVEFGNKHAFLPDSPAIANQSNLSEILKSRVRFNDTFENCLLTTIDCIPSNFNKTSTALLLSRLLAVFYYQTSRIDAALPIFLDIVKSSLCDQSTLIFCHFMILHCNIDSKIKLTSLCVLLTTPSTKLLDFSHQLYPQNQDIATFLQPNELFKQFQTTLIDINNDLTIVIPTLIDILTVTPNNGKLHLTFISHFLNTLKCNEIQLDYTTNGSVSSTTYNSFDLTGDIQTIKFNIHLFATSLLTQLKLILSPHISIIIPLNYTVTITSSTPQFVLSVTPPTFIPIPLKTSNLHFLVSINITTPIDSLLLTFTTSCLSLSQSISESSTLTYHSPSTLKLESFTSSSITVKVPILLDLSKGNHGVTLVVSSQHFTTKKKVIIPARSFYETITDADAVLRNSTLMINIPIKNISTQPLPLTSIALTQSITQNINEILLPNTVKTIALDVTGLVKSTPSTLTLTFPFGTSESNFFIKYSPPSYAIKLDYPSIIRCCVPFSFVVNVESFIEKKESVNVRVVGSSFVVVSGFENQQINILPKQTLSLEYECIAMESGTTSIPSVVLTTERPNTHVAFQEETTDLTVLPLQSNFFGFISTK